MQLLKDTFRFEWKQLLRQPLQWSLLLFFFAVGCYSLLNGRNFTDRQLSGLDSLEKNQQLHLKELIDRFHTDTSTTKGKTLALQAGIPQVVEFRAPPVATNPPQAAALMAIGQRDLLPYYDVINSKRDIFNPANMEIANPEKLAAGNFDLSFVLLYLFPLLVIVLSYDILSAEKEQQTDRLLAIQGAVLHRILFYKWLFRVLLVWALAIVLSITGFIIAPSATHPGVTDACCWIFVTCTYLLFWFSMCWLVILCGWTSRINVLSLMGIWLTLTLMLPALANKIAEVSVPMPLRADLASRQREVMTATWEMPRTELIRLFYKNNPKYLPLKDPADTAQYGNKRFVAYYDLLGRRMDHNIRVYRHAIQAHNKLLRTMAWLNPVAQYQHLLNATAQTGMEDYLFYQQEVNRFQHQWVTFMNNKLLQNKKLSITEVQNLPGFQPQPNLGRPLRIILATGSIWLAILLIGAGAFRLSSSINSIQ